MTVTLVAFADCNAARKPGKIFGGFSRMRSSKSTGCRTTPRSAHEKTPPAARRRGRGLPLAGMLRDRTHSPTIHSSPQTRIRSIPLPECDGGSREKNRTAFYSLLNRPFALRRSGRLRCCVLTLEIATRGENRAPILRILREFPQSLIHDGAHGSIAQRSTQCSGDRV